MTEQPKSLAKVDRHNTPHAKRIKVGIGRQLMFGGVAAAVLIFGLGGMAATIDFAGAVVAHGRLVVSSNVKKVQHQSGGTISEIKVKDGDDVKAGDVLVQLDSTMAAANLGIVVKGLDEALARTARLTAEQIGADHITFSPDLLARANLPEVAELIKIETAAFETRRAAGTGKKDQLHKKVAELEQQVVGAKAQEDSVRRQIALTARDLEGLRSLRDQNLVSTARISDEERRAAQLDGQLGQIISGAAQIGSEIAQTELQIIQVDQDLRSEVSREITDVGSKISELSERKIAAQDQLDRLAIRAPITGTVYQMTVHTVGGVVAPGEVIMMVVPDKDLLVVEAQIDPNQVDQVHPQQVAALRFSSLGGRTTPEYSGAVETISPDLVVDPRTNVSYYLARVALPSDALTELGAKMVPGMPVEVFISTDKRTVLSYLVKPLADQVLHTFREE